MADSTAKPIWVTTAGDLGTVPENEFYQLTLEAIDDVTQTDADLKFRVIAGSLPTGVQVTTQGVLAGVPRGSLSVQGVPQEVDDNTKSEFTVRAYNELNGVQNRVADRTFNITITGADAPVWVTKSSDIKNHNDGENISYQLEVTDSDPSSVVEFTLLTGTLPPGVTLSLSGLLSGVILPSDDLPGDATAGWDVDGVAFDEFPMDFSSKGSSKNFQFTIEASDGRFAAVQEFNMFVFSKDDLTADSGDIRADETDVTADTHTARTPVLTTPAGDIGTYRHDNYFAFQFEGFDADGDPFEFALTSGAATSFDADGVGFDATGVGFDRISLDLPPGLVLDQDTGYLYGTIPAAGLTETVYTFGVLVKKQSGIREDSSVELGEVSSPLTYYTMTVIGGIDSEITWVTGATLPNINNGDISNLKIEATTASGAELQYKIASISPTGSTVNGMPDTVSGNNKLPQGLELMSSGNIVGQCSFQMFEVDTGTTTFDEDIATRRNIDPTIFDRTFTFTVNAYNNDALISVFKEFTLYVELTYKEPYQRVYIKCMPEQADRDLLLQLIDNNDIFQEDLIYRPDDPNFGVSEDIIYDHAYGIKVKGLADYVTAMQYNHYHKKLTVGSVKVAQALDSSNNVIYEVVYAEIKDDLVNSDGESIGLSVIRTPFLEDFLQEPSIDAAKRASSTVTTADATGLTCDISFERDVTETADSVAVLADNTTILADVGLADNDDGSSITIDNSAIDTVYPNSLENMRTRVIDKMGQFAKVLPDWMKSKQTDGQVLGFTPAWVIAYTNPGKGAELKYNIDTKFTGKLNTIDFYADRYSLDNSHTQFWNTTTLKWIQGDMSTFDKFSNHNKTFVGNVDFATELGFADIHNATLAEVTALGGFDGTDTITNATTMTGKTILFQNHNSYGGDDGSTPSYDEAFTREYLFDSSSELIPGPDQIREDSSTVWNERMAIYEITVDATTNRISLTLKTLTSDGDYVEIQDGTKYGASLLFFPEFVRNGQFYVEWTFLELSLTNDATNFDGGSCRFINNKDTRTNDDSKDSYVLYPKHTIRGNTDYIVL